MRSERTLHPQHPTRGAAVGGGRAFLLTALLLPATLLAQVGVTTFGIQIKPVIPFSFFDPLTSTGTKDLYGTLELTGGAGFGMVVRTGLSRTLSLETGINQITRRYDYRIVNDTADYENGSGVRFIGYEIPVLMLVYIRLGENTWMNNALGVSADMYPSDVVNTVDQGRLYLFRKNWIQCGAVANIGVEYRTYKSGYFYLGATYHRPFTDIAVAEFTWQTPTLFPYSVRTPIDGSYLTIDFRYFFHEPADKARLRKDRGVL